MNDKVTKTEILVFVLIVIAMLGSLVYGFFVVGVGQIENCWDQYTTEKAAIENCEGKNK
jgi:hypothetical protein